jgi:two-component system, NarL family, nitrate/nitrite response regulator NarL
MRITGTAGDVDDAAAIGIVLVAEHLVLREGLRRLLEAEPGFIVIGDVSDPEEAIGVARTKDAIILVVGFSGRPLIRLVRTLHQLAPAGANGRTIVLTTKIAKPHMLQAREFGVSKFLLKEASSRTLVETVRSVAAGDHNGGSPTTASATEAAAAEVAAPPVNGTATKTAFGLTSRELDIVAAVRRGESNRAIARKFSLSEDTVKHHLTRVFDKTGVFSRLELAMFAIKHGLGDNAVNSVNG